MLDAFESDHRYVVWLDIDIEFKKEMPDDLFPGLIDGSAVAYLGRGGTYPETGCVIFDTQHADFPVFKSRLRFCYDERRLFTLKYYIDCMAIQESMSKLDVKDLTPHVQGMVDVFSQSPLDEYMVHDKGQGHGKYREAI